jgi:hypothetical protein
MIVCGLVDGFVLLFSNLFIVSNASAGGVVCWNCNGVKFLSLDFDPDVRFEGFPMVVRWPEGLAVREQV